MSALALENRRVSLAERAFDESSRARPTGGGAGGPNLKAERQSIQDFTRAGQDYAAALARLNVTESVTPEGKTILLGTSNLAEQEALLSLRATRDALLSDTPAAYQAAYRTSLSAPFSTVPGGQTSLSPTAAGLLPSETEAQRGRMNPPPPSKAPEQGRVSEQDKLVWRAVENATVEWNRMLALQAASPVPNPQLAREVQEMQTRILTARARAIAGASLAEVQAELANIPVPPLR